MLCGSRGRSRSRTRHKPGNKSENPGTQPATRDFNPVDTMTPQTSANAEGHLKLQSVSSKKKKVGPYAKNIRQGTFIFSRSGEPTANLQRSARGVNPQSCNNISGSSKTQNKSLSIKSDSARHNCQIQRLLNEFNASIGKSRERSESRSQSRSRNSSRNRSNSRRRGCGNRSRNSNKNRSKSRGGSCENVSRSSSGNRSKSRGGSSENVSRNSSRNRSKSRGRSGDSRSRNSSLKRSKCRVGSNESKSGSSSRKRSKSRRQSNENRNRSTSRNGSKSRSRSNEKCARKPKQRKQRDFGCSADALANQNGGDSSLEVCLKQLSQDWLKYDKKTDRLKLNIPPDADLSRFAQRLRTVNSKVSGTASKRGQRSRAGEITQDRSANNSNSRLLPWTEILAAYEAWLKRSSSSPSRTTSEDTSSDQPWSDESEEEEDFRGKLNESIPEGCKKSNRRSNVDPTESRLKAASIQPCEADTKISRKPKIAWADSVNFEAGRKSDSDKSCSCVDDSDLFIAMLTNLFKNFFEKNAKRVKAKKSKVFTNTNESLSKVYARSAQPCAGSNKSTNGKTSGSEENYDQLLRELEKCRRAYETSVYAEPPENRRSRSSSATPAPRGQRSSGRSSSRTRSKFPRAVTYAQLYRDRVRYERSPSRHRSAVMPLTPRFEVVERVGRGVKSCVSPHPIETIKCLPAGLGTDGHTVNNQGSYTGKDCPVQRDIAVNDTRKHPVQEIHIHLPLESHSPVQPSSASSQIQSSRRKPKSQKVRPLSASLQLTSRRRSERNTTVGRNQESSQSQKGKRFASRRSLPVSAAQTVVNTSNLNQNSIHENSIASVNNGDLDKCSLSYQNFIHENSIPSVNNGDLDKCSLSGLEYTLISPPPPPSSPIDSICNGHGHASSNTTTDYGNATRKLESHKGNTILSSHSSDPEFSGCTFIRDGEPLSKDRCIEGSYDFNSSAHGEAWIDSADWRTPTPETPRGRNFHSWSQISSGRYGPRSTEEITTEGEHSQNKVLSLPKPCRDEATMLKVGLSTQPLSVHGVGGLRHDGGADPNHTAHG